MRKALIISIVLLAIIATVFFLQDRTKSPIQPWDLVSANTLAVIETNDAIAYLTKTKLFALAKLPVWTDDLKQNKIKGLILIQRSSVEKLDTALLFPYAEKEVNLFPARKDFVQRSLSGYTIQEYKNVKPSFAHAIVEDHLVVGSPLVIEDVIRTLRTESRSSFHEKHAELFRLSSLQSDDGNLYLNFSQLPFSDKGAKHFFAASSLYDIKINGNQISMNGFVTDSATQMTFLSLFKDQPPAPFKLKEVLPSASTRISHFAIQDFKSWEAHQHRYANTLHPGLATEIVKMKSFAEWDAFAKHISNELSISTLPDDEETSRILVLKVKGEGALSRIHNKLDSTYHEEYAEYQIRKFTDDFAEKVFWPLTANLELRYVTEFNSHLVFAQSPNVIKFFISENLDDNTVARSMEWSKFLSTSLQEATVSYFLSGEELQAKIGQLGFNPKYFDLGALEQASFQFSGLENNFYSNAVLNFSSETSGVPREKITSTIFTSSIIGAPTKVINHTNNTGEIILQDSSFSLHLISKSKVLWSYPLQQAIATDITQIDFYNNRKLQYLFATRDQLHLVDRLGRSVKGFPKSFPKSDFEDLKPVDYDGTKNYRFLLTEADKIMISDKQGNPLDGWNPLKISGKVKEAGHERIFGKDHFFVLTDAGVLTLYGRNGIAMKGFPVDVRERATGIVYVQGATFESSYFLILGESGVLSKISLTGAILLKEPLLKSVADSHFNLINNGESAIISRVDKGKIAFFDLSGKMLFEKQNPVSEKIAISYLNSKKGVIAVFDDSQDLLMLYDKSGAELLQQPVEATSLPVIEILAKEKIRIYYANNTELISRLL